MKSLYKTDARTIVNLLYFIALDIYDFLAICLYEYLNLN